MKKKRVKGRAKDNTRIVVITMSILFFLTIAGFYLLNWYIRIDVGKESQTEGNYIASKSVQTISQEKQDSQTVTQMLEEVSSCVVGISKLKDNGSSIFLQDGMTKLGLGTGIIVSEDGYIITNEHVSGGKYSSCYVTLENGKNYTANVLWSNSDLDVAMLKINAKSLPYATFGDSDQLQVGQSVYAIGNPIGFEFQRSVTGGIISATNRTIKIEEEEKISYMEDLIQTDATINPGNSGGPLINLAGQVIGINTIKITSAEGMGFAIPVNVIKPVLESYQAKGNFEEASLGIYAYDQEVIPYLDRDITIENGIYVIDVIPGGAASKAGLKANDIICKIDGMQLNKMTQLRRYIYTKEPKDTVTLFVQRKGIAIPVKVQLGKK